MKNAIGILMGTALNLCITLGNIWTFNNILARDEHRIFFHLLVSLISFINMLQFSVYTSFTYLVKFIPNF